MSTPLRFQDANLRLSDFVDNILVECPKCSKQAVVRKNKKPQSGVKLTCPECHYQSTDNMMRYDIHLKTYCNSCAHPIVVKKFLQKQPVYELNITCPKCTKEENYQTKVTRLNCPTVSNRSYTDPWFGCELWLQYSFKSEIFWANNYEHLAYMKRYIQAGLRQRFNREFFTLAEKLPAFIKSEKNRDKLLKLINRIEKK